MPGETKLARWLKATRVWRHAIALKQYATKDITDTISANIEYAIRGAVETWNLYISIKYNTECMVKIKASDLQIEL